MSGPHTLPTVKAGDLIRVHIPPLPDLWKVDELLHTPGTWGYFLRISQNSGMVSRTIAPRGFEVVSSADDRRRERVRTAIRELGIIAPAESEGGIPIELPTLGRGRLEI